jgi:hypothetical protein
VIRGNVAFPANTHPALRWITLIQTEQGGQLVRSARPDANGDYSFRVGPGDYEISVPALNMAGGRLVAIGGPQLRVAKEREIVRNFPARNNAAAISKRVDQGVEPRAAGAHERARAAAGFTQLKTIGLAFHNYHDIYGQFPPAVLVGPDGKTQYSWRVELLPLLRYDADVEIRRKWDAIRTKDRQTYWALIERLGYKLNEPWDSESNIRFQKQFASYFRNPGMDATSVECAYFVVTGEGTVFPNETGTTFAAITDGPSNTLHVVESKREVPWTKPVDIAYSADAELPAFGGYSEGGFLALTCDGAIHLIPKETAAKEIRALITRAGKETFTIGDLDRLK